MRFRIDLAGSALLAAGLALAMATAFPVSGQDSSSSVAPTSSQPSATSVAAADTRPEADILAAGKSVWNDAACYNCHGNNGQGGHSTDFPNGPNLRKSLLDPQTMLATTECGLPDTRMPAWLKGAYTETPCYGDETGPVLPGVLIAGAYTREQLQDLISYIQVNFMKKPMPSWSDQ